LAEQKKQRGGVLARLLHSQHTAFSATVLLTVSAALSRVMGLGREKFIAYFFGAGMQTDAYNAAFQLPEWVNYFLVGGTASITFVTILSRYRDRGEHAEGERALSAILTAMLIVLGAGTLIGELIAPWYVHIFFPGFSPAQAELCTHMTRILLPAQICFFAGGVFGAVMLTNKQFGYQALTPIVYNAGIILGGVLLARTMGIPSLAVGAVAGAFFGALVLNAAGAYRIGVRYRPVIDFKHPGLREWVRLSVPLMLGVSLVTFDNYILSYFASHARGDITRLTYAKRLFSAPMAVIGQAAGAASLPFFATLMAQGKREKFASTVNASVSRILAFSLLLSAWMAGLAYPAVDLIFRGGRFGHGDAETTAVYFAIFSVSLAMWSAQAIYARAFYAAGNTFTPMVLSTIVTLASLPVYRWMYMTMGVTGLALASNLGILAQTVTLAIALDVKGFAKMRGLEWGELLRAFAAGIAGLLALRVLVREMPAAGLFRDDLLLLGVGTVAWVAVSWLVLVATRSTLPGQLRARLQRRSA
jgi:putative peptidoglycan lipid II flippase